MKESIRPSENTRHFAHEIFHSFGYTHLDRVKIFNVSPHDSLDQCFHRIHVPLVQFQSFLEDLVEEDTEGLRSLQCCDDFDSILENSSSLAFYRVGHNRRRDEMIGMKDDHVVGVVHNAVAGSIKVADQMDV